MQVLVLYSCCEKVLSVRAHTIGCDWFLLSSDLQGSEGTRLKPQHISTLVVSLAEFVRMADRKIIAGTLSQLKLELDFDSTAISQLQVVLFGFQDAVSINQDPCVWCQHSSS